jgi:hypothetical protein
MTFEQRSSGLAAEPGPTSGAATTPVQVRLQILSTEHWSLLASRSLAWNESFTRAGMFLSTLSGAIVALSLIGGVDGFSDAFRNVALVILPVVLFVGVGTWLRMAAANYHDAMTVYGMNRIRAAYLEIAPELAPYFVMGTHDDQAGIGITMAVPPGTAPWVHLVAGTPSLVIALNGVIAGAIAALAAIQFLTLPGPVALAIAIVAAAILIVIEVQFAQRNIRRGQHAIQPMFPTPPIGDRPPA